MARTTLVFGLSLLVLGVGAYLYALTTETASVTALIPAFFGIPILALWAASARRPARQTLFTVLALALAVLGVIGAGRGLLSLPALLRDREQVARPAAVIVQSAMAVLCVVYVILAARFLIVTRRR